MYGATAAGVTAAVAAARHGVDVTLLEPGRHIGGMVSSGLGYTDIGDRRVIGGMAGAFAAAVADHYGTALWHWAGPEPHVAEAIFVRWLEEAGVDVVLDCGPVTAQCSDGVIEAVVTGDGARHPAGVFVDASYEGDLLALAGVPYAVGREGRERYGESHAGRRPMGPGKHNFPPFLSPFRNPDEIGGEEDLLPFVHRRPAAEIGAGDGGVMAYAFRVCLTRSPRRMPIDRRPGYDEAEWELARRYFHWVARNASGDDLTAGRFVGLVNNIPGEKCDANSLGPFSLNLLDGDNWAYPTASPEERERIRRRHLHYTHDFLYFLRSDASVPAPVRREAARWGLPSDEFVDTGGWPPQLYIREARRMLGEYVLTRHDLLPRPRPHYDAIAMGSYHIDIREVQRTWCTVWEHPKPLPCVYNEGYLSVPVRPYQIPYRSIVPRFGDCENLLVPVCLSASHVAFASVRMEVQYEMLGHAAGVAAMLALRDGQPVQRVPIGELQQRLVDEGQVLAV